MNDGPTLTFADCCALIDWIQRVTNQSVDTRRSAGPGSDGGPYLHMDPSDLHPACDHYIPLAHVRACRKCGKPKSEHPPCPDCGKKHFKVGQVLVRAHWGRGALPPGGYLLSGALQCKNCGYSPDYSGFIRRR